MVNLYQAYCPPILWSLTISLLSTATSPSLRWWFDFSLFDPVSFLVFQLNLQDTYSFAHFIKIIISKVSSHLLLKYQYLSPNVHGEENDRVSSAVSDTFVELFLTLCSAILEVIAFRISWLFGGSRPQLRDPLGAAELGIGSEGFTSSLRLGFASSCAWVVYLIPFQIFSENHTGFSYAENITKSWN